uniref:MPN domain-containing protein n=1 Tax=Tabanus bromius TaxID=304241 RepID=A0A0K8TR42_TABBR
MGDFEISSCTYIKMILHAAKYPHCSINGVLLASKDSSKGKTRIIDAVPLFHQCLHVSPMAEIALIQIEAFAAERNLYIAGYYAASENFNETSIEKVPGIKIAEKIYENYSSACLIIIDNKNVSLRAERPAIKVWYNSENRWSRANFSLDNTPYANTLETISDLLQKGAMKAIIDFDNHLDNPKNDWTNEVLTRDLLQVISMY